MKKQTKPIVPTFATEAEEAEWWYKNRNVHGRQLLAAVNSGEARILTKEKLLERIAASKKTSAAVVALRIPEADLALARKQAEQKRSAVPDLHQISVARTLAEREKRKWDGRPIVLARAVAIPSSSGLFASDDGGVVVDG
jgi:hypothetical protein